MIKKILAALACLLIVLGIASGVAAAQHSRRTSTSNNIMTMPTTSTSSSVSSSTSTPARTGIYAAMGDSIAAGAGLPLASNATSEDARCSRSPQGYPNIVAQQKGMSLN